LIDLEIAEELEKYRTERELCLDNEGGADYNLNNQHEV
jgi:hypothetical protein